MTDPAKRDYSRSRAVVMGTWTYTDFKENTPAVRRSFHRMRDLLQDPVCGPWPSTSVKAFENPSTLGTIHVELIETLLEATDVALFYYVGHGIYDHRERLCLTVGDTRTNPNFTAATALPFEAVRDAFNVSKAAIKIAVLDCCHAGLAAQDYGRLSATLPMPVSGTYMLMSSSAFEASWYEKEDVADAQTCFTKALVDTVREGVRGAPAGLTFDHIFGVVADRLVKDGIPEPGRRVENRAAHWVFARNNAPDTRPEPGDDPDALYREAYRREREEGIERLPAIAAMYRAAAEAGHVPSMNRLGQIAEGRVQARMQGIEPGPVDGRALVEATRWYTQAVEAGDQVGPLHLGQLYEERYKDEKTALHWYDIAARRGNSAAQERLTGLEQRIRLGTGTARRPGAESAETPAPTHPQPAAGTTLATEARRQRWLADWDGMEPLAIAQCLDVLVDACGGTHGEWAVLDESEQKVLLIDFLALLPPRADLARAARRYYQAIGPGKLRDHVAGVGHRPQ